MTFPKLAEKQLDQIGFGKKSVILLSLAGSRSYGTFNEDSDYDYKGILIPPQDFILSPFKFFEQTMWKGEGETGRVSEKIGKAEADEEGTIFGIRKFVKLAASANPNVIETLFVDEKHIVHQTDEGKELRKNRELFLSQRACKTFTGYASSQLGRIKTHRSWLGGSAKELPLRKNFNLPEKKMISGEQMGAARAFVRRNLNVMSPWLLESDNQHKESFWEGVEELVGLILSESGHKYDSNSDTWVQVENNTLDKLSVSLGFDINFVEYLKNEKRYAQAMQNHKQYKSWLKNRNPARAKLESKFSYDAKHAYHLVRLLKMGEEVLRDGKLNVYRSDREELKDIRNGAWTYDELVSWADEKTTAIYDLVRNDKAVVPKIPDQNAIEKLVINLQKNHWRR
jgi:predicted nucleotidyltransferase